MEKSTYRIHWSNTDLTINRVIELQAINELDARIKAHKYVKNYGGIPYTGMIAAQRKYIHDSRGSYITLIEKMGVEYQNAVFSV